MTPVDLPGSNIPEGLQFLLSARTGHYRMESGHHSQVWMEFNTLFMNPSHLRPFITRLAGLLAPLQPDALCGPYIGGMLLASMTAMEMGIEFFHTLRQADPGEGMYPVQYHLPADLHTHVSGKRVIVVDDVINAGSAVLATCDELAAHGAEVIAVGALVTLGDTGVEAVAARGLPLLSISSHPNRLYLPDECPLCQQGVELTEVK